MATRDPSLVPNTRTRSLGGTISILQSGKPVAISKATRTDGNHAAIGAKSDRTSTAEYIGKYVDPLDDLSPAQVVNQRDTIASAYSEELAVVRECQHVGSLRRVWGAALSLSAAASFGTAAWLLLVHSHHWGDDNRNYDASGGPAGGVIVSPLSRGPSSRTG